MTRNMTGTAQPSQQNRDNPLVKALAQALPKDSHYTAWHLSTTPTPAEALCYPPALNSTTEKRPSKPLKTYCEKHFLAVSVTEPARTSDVLVLGLEVYIYTTAFSTAIFVAKADSTGYSYIQSTPPGFSPIRAVTIAFLDFLVEHRRRPAKQLIINLFARAQAQYLFPGSVKNDKKHILDDRGLIKWWCRVLNPLLENHVQKDTTRTWDHVHGYLIIPGLDDYETRAFIPRTEHAARNWSLRHPLELISPYTKEAANYGYIPPRCLIPTYPDDPKARFVEELEESTSEKTKLLSGWKTPKTLDQFWEMMAFRQECSSGRITGFVWLVFEPPAASTSSQKQNANRATSTPATTTLLTPAASFSDPSNHVGSLSTPGNPQEAGLTSLETPASSPSRPALSSVKLRQRKRKAKKILKGPIIPREPRVKTHHAKFPGQIDTPYYYWPEAGRGQVVLDDSGYKRAVELLLHLEFKGLEQAIASTSRWTGEVNMGDGWALPVTGEKILAESAPALPIKTMNNLTGLIQKKRKSEDEPSNDIQPTMLSKGLVRKKAKLDNNEGLINIQSANEVNAEPRVNILGSGLVKKKPKTS
ncbi:hypothetical protein F5B22DRAFT_589773 [Xylaria bambusicola]|uniref:uncharacterized protein n=1 Tax=Xylaria bambusicola TaxID=326684 RepID=UPI002007E03C|nr:uncharacterized protein F5B22DRAFT_589773 [Xylaria bambusicola]KAI0525402.1 hypothetical protein F5B22DRAFT_589773 [Xylaria bambusicola]